jgi:hypothetical protein
LRAGLLSAPAAIPFHFIHAEAIHTHFPALPRRAAGAPDLQRYRVTPKRERGPRKRTWPPPCLRHPTPLGSHPCVALSCVGIWSAPPMRGLRRRVLKKGRPGRESFESGWALLKEFLKKEKWPAIRSNSS